MTVDQAVAPQWIGTCVHLQVRDLDDFDRSSREVTYRTFRRLLGGKIVGDLDRQFGVPLRGDYAVEFATGKWKGRRAVCLFHSAIHHIWVLS
jgi:hypothetical protein